MDAEYFSTHRLTRKSDVYAFGVVLLETLCGTPALDFTLDEQQHSLAGWAKHCIKEGKISQIIDPCLRGQVSANCVKEFGQIAYECLLTSSKDRPTMTKVLSRLEFVLAWTLRNLQSTNDQKHNGRTTFIEKAWLLLSTKAPVRMSSDIKRLGQNNGNKKRGKVMEKHVTTVAEIGCPSDGVVSVSQQVLPPSYESISPTLKEFTYSELRTATRNFRKDKVLGEGGFGRVYKGWLNSATYEPQRVSDQIAVAIKQSKPESLQGLKEWQAELIFLGNLSHPNLVKLFGYCWENEDYFLVYEYMQKESLERHLFREGAEPLSWCTRIKVAMGAAQGLAFLHSTGNNVIYRDMKPPNILFDGDFNAKLSDFGLAKLGPVNGESHVSTQVVGTYGYAAPEYIATGQLYVKSDVYGFGSVMLEIITGLRTLDRNLLALNQNLVDWARPFLGDKKRLHRIMDPRLDQDYPLKGASKFAELILRCLESEPTNRPSMEEVVSVLQVINEIKMTPRQIKANTSHSSNRRHQNHHRFPFGTKHNRGAWSTSSWLSGIRVLIGSKQDRARTETNRSKTEKWGNHNAT